MGKFKIVFFLLLIFPALIYSQNKENHAANNRDVIFHIYPHKIDQMEDKSYAGFIMESFQRAEAEGASMVVLEINTPGGALDATLEIKNIIFASRIKSVCFVNQNAISAGSIIAMSCDKIVMSKGSVMGAATPVYQKDGEMKKASEKVVSATRAAIRAAAEARGKNGKIAESFVDENTVLTMEKDGIDKPAGKLLTLTTEEAVRLKMADYSAESVEEIILAEGFENFAIEPVQPSYYRGILDFFLHPVVSGILLALGVLGLFNELKAPGWGVSGMIGITFISIFFITRIMGGYSGWEAPALFAFSLFLIFLELFVIPGFGVAGIIGFLGMLGAIFWSFGIDNFEEGITTVAIALGFSAIGLVLIIRMLPKMIQSDRGIFLAGNLEKDNERTLRQYEFLLGKTGTALTVLRPSGSVQIENKHYDAVSDSGFIESGQKVQVMQVEGARIVVEKID